MKLLKLKKQIFACLCGLFMLFGVGGIVALQQSSDTPVTVAAAAAPEITVATDPWSVYNESKIPNSKDRRFRILFNNPINNQADAWASNVSLEQLNGLQDKLLIAGKTPTEWSQLGVDFRFTPRSSSQPVFTFNGEALDNAKLNFFDDTFVLELKEDCVLNNNFGTVKAFKIHVTTSANGQVCLQLAGSAKRAEGPFLYDNVTGNTLQVKMWFAQSVIAANDGSDVGITIDKMEGLQNVFYFNGKSLAQWAAEGALGVITARNAGGFIFRFDTTKFDTTKAYLVEIKQAVKTTKGVVQPFAYWIKPGLTYGNFFNQDGTLTGNAYAYQGKEFDFSRVSFDLKINNANTLKMWFTDGANEAPVVTANNGDGYAKDIYMEGLEKVLKIDGKTIAEWETLLGDGFSIGSRASDGRLTPYFSLAALAENNFIGKNFAVELENDYMTSQGVVKAFKYVYNWAMGEGVLNPAEEEVTYVTSSEAEMTDEFFYFDVTFDKDIVKTAPAVDTPLSNDDLQKADLSNLVKVNGKDVATAMYSIAVVKETTNTLRFSILNAELSHNVYFELLAGYVFPNGNVLAEDITLYYNEQNGTWQTTAMPNITVVYNANGGEGEMIGSTVAYGSDYLLAENTFTNLGYEFAGWARTADGKVVFKDAENLHLYVGGALENVNSTTLNLYAVWQKERGVRFMSISMAGDIGLNFYVDLDDAEEVTATITMKGESTTVVGVYQETLNCWKFTYGVAPKDYQEIVSISVADVVAEYSVAAYADALPEDNAAYPIVAELMEYCEAARVYFANEEATATEDLTADLSEYEATIEGEEENVTIAGATLVLESKTTINVYVTAESLEDVVCTVDGEAVTPVALEGQDGQYVISISGIVSKDLDKVYTIKVGGYTITYCALSYVEETLSGTVDNVALVNLVKAMYSLSVEAEQYFTAIE